MVHTIYILLLFSWVLLFAGEKCVQTPSIKFILFFKRGSTPNMTPQKIDKPNSLFRLFNIQKTNFSPYRGILLKLRIYNFILIDNLIFIDNFEVLLSVNLTASIKDIHMEEQT